MNLLLLYLLLAKATFTTFSGLGSVPVIHSDFVEHRHLLTDRQLSAAVAAGRTAPGPNGSYIVSVGYFIAGIPGACAGALAVMTPAFLIIPLLRYLGRRAERPRVKSAIEAITLAAAGLIVNAAIPLAQETVTDWLTAAIALASFLMLIFSRLPSIWVMLAAAAAGLAGKWVA